MTLSCVQFSSAKDFLQTSEGYLLRNESFHNLILGLAGSISVGSRQENEAVFFSILQHGKVVGAALRTDVDKPLAISLMSGEIIEILIEYLRRFEMTLSGVVGPKDACIDFSRLWTAAGALTHELYMHQGIYETRSVVVPPADGGAMVQISNDRRVIAREFIGGFIRECFPSSENVSEQVEVLLDRHMRHKTCYFWQNADGELVAMAAKNRESKNAATISLVFTPQHARGKGYASCLVASLTQKLLSEDKPMCNLYTDLKNPTSNSIYQKMGYEFVGEGLHYLFRQKN